MPPASPGLLDDPVEWRACVGVGGSLYGCAMTEWAAITEAIGVALGGDRARGRELLAACWEATTDQDAARRCVLAHYLADAQDDLDEEVAWDEAALVAFAGVAEADLNPVGIPSARALEPSLRLNLGDGYRRQGRFEDAKKQVDAGDSLVYLLPEDGYVAMIRAGLTRLRGRVESQSSEG